MNQPISTIPQKNRAATWLSLVGHPLVMIPLTVTLLTMKEDANTQWSILTPIILLMAILLVYSRWQVRRGRWQDSDASQPPERKTLLIVLAVCLVAFVIITSTRIFPSELAIGMFVSALQVFVTIIFSRWLKLSFHSMFNAYCSLLVFPLGIAAVIGGLAWTALISWSRIVLKRHTIVEVLIGTGVGVGGGLLFLLLTEQLNIH